MTLQRKAPLLVVIVALATSTILVWAANNSNLKLLEAAKKREMQITADVLQRTLGEYANNGASKASLLASLPYVQRLLRDKDHTRLAEEMIPALKQQNVQFGVREAQFHLPPAISFLDVLGKTAYLEDLSGYREIVLATNRRHEPQTGFEVGRRGLGLRGIVEVNDAKGPIGSVEIAMELMNVLNSIKNMAGTETGLFVDNNLMKTIAIEHEPPAKDSIVGPYWAILSTNWKILAPLVTPEILTASTDISTTWRTVGGIPYGILVVPIRDFKGSSIGVMVAARNFESFDNQLGSGLVTIVALVLLQAVLLAWIVITTFNGMLMRPVSRLSAMIGKLAGGDTTIDLGDLKGRPDEVGAMAKGIETLRNYVAGKEKRG